MTLHVVDGSQARLQVHMLHSAFRRQALLQRLRQHETMELRRRSATDLPAGHLAATVNVPTARRLDGASAAAAASILCTERRTAASRTPRRSMVPVHVPRGEEASIIRPVWPQRRLPSIPRKWAPDAITPARSPVLLIREIYRSSRDRRAVAYARPAAR